MTASPPQVTLSRQKYLSLLEQNCHMAGFINALATMGLDAEDITHDAQQCLNEVEGMRYEDQ